MKIDASPFQGLFMATLAPYRDERGAFARTFDRKLFREATGHDLDFVQTNQSWNALKGTLRGMHYQHPPFAEFKLIRCIRGAVHDVVIDVRQGSDTFLKHFAIELSEQNMVSLLVPAGFAHGFITLTDNTELVYMHTAYYAPGHEGGLRYDDPKLAIHWPVEVQVITEKDLAYQYIDSGFEGLNLL